MNKAIAVGIASAVLIVGATVPADATVNGAKIAFDDVGGGRVTVYDRNNCRGHSLPVYPGGHGGWSDNRSFKVSRDAVVEKFDKHTGRYLGYYRIRANVCSKNQSKNRYYVITTSREV